MKKELTSGDIMDLFQKSKGKLNILWESLSCMQQYNGRSKITCIAMAMGYETDGDGNYFK